MTQPINFSFNVSPTHLVAAVVISQILFTNRISEIFGKKIHDMSDLALAAGTNLVLDFPVIALTTGLTYAVHQLTPYAPALALSSDAMSAATFVGGLFALKSAMTPLLTKVTESATGSLLDSLSSSKQIEVPSEHLLRNTFVLHFLPLALGTLYAYYASVPVRLAQSALYTVSLIGVVKLLGKGLESICSINEVKETIQNWYFGWK